MAEPTLLGDIIQPAWQSLTPEQRNCWHWWAAAHPQTDELGRLRTFYGQQAHYSRNAELAVVESVPLLSDPPPDENPPFTVAILSVAWPLQSLLSGTTTARRGLVYLQLSDAMPSDAVAIVRQGYSQKKTGRGRPPRIRHVTILVPTQTGDVSLVDSLGYFASTAGSNRYATIHGQTAQRRPDLPLGTIRFTSITNGTTIAQTLKNPFGGARKKTNRARATATAPTTGVNHYP